MNAIHKRGGLSPEEKLKNASKDLLKFAEEILEWAESPCRRPSPKIIEAGFDAVKKAGGKLPKKP